MSGHAAAVHTAPLQPNEFTGHNHDPAWVAAQKNIFARWFQVALHRAKSPRVVSGPTLLKDLHDGVVLLQTMQVMFPQTKLPYYFDPAQTVVQQLDNCTTLLRAVQQAGIRFEFVTPKNIVEGDEAPVMGLVWLMLKEFEIKEAIQKAHVLDELILHDEQHQQQQKQQQQEHQHQPQHLQPQQAHVYVVPSPSTVEHQLASTEAPKPPIINIPQQTVSTLEPVAEPAAATAAAAALAAVDASVALSPAAPATAAEPDAATAAASAVVAATEPVKTAQSATPAAAAAAAAAITVSAPVATAAAAQAAAAPAVADAHASAGASSSIHADGWRLALLRWIQSRCAPFGIKCNALADINANVLLCILKSLEPDAVKDFDVHDTKLSLQQMLDVAEAKLHVPKLFEANEQISEWAWSLYISLFLVYLPHRYNYLRGAYDKAIGLLERIDAAHQGVLTRIDEHKNHFEESLNALHHRAKHAVRSAYVGYLSNSSLGNILAGPK